MYGGNDHVYGVICTGTLHRKLTTVFGSTELHKSCCDRPGAYAIFSSGGEPEDLIEDWEGAIVSAFSKKIAFCAFRNLNLIAIQAEDLLHCLKKHFMLMP
ncbi:hypothetical protein FRX31_027207 [Thalictrum thalictroides]|uniref:Uncharacterized protein n=1 Tax=Thalictrum thalictroides TaxID=46969 RepID=A0A7J6VG76_THATH|nr:hypothetical protein FRX31_027207 [Thalictrum thalictroides]